MTPNANYCTSKLTSDSAGALNLNVSTCVGGLVQHVWIEIRAVRPHQRPCLRIHGNAREVCRVLQWRKHAAAPRDPRAHIGHTVGAIGERQRDAERTNDLDLRDAWQHGLLQRGDLRRGLVRMQAAPVLEQFRLMETSPFDHERQGARR